MNEISPKFFRELKTHFDTEVYERIVSSLDAPPSVSIRINRNKPINAKPGWKHIPWTKHGFRLESRPAFSQDPLHHAGCYYVQDASSMILEYILDQLDLDEGILALDACAAPGGKSIILSDFLERKGLLVANEIDAKRNAILRENLFKWGATNCLTTQLSASKISNTDIQFDLVVIDAPCSGEGMFRKDSFARTQWSESLVHNCIETQQSILNELKHVVREDGYIIYSTCTLNKRENENQIAALLDDGFELALPDLSTFSEFAIPAAHNNFVVGYYFPPGISLGEGLFVSVLKKTGVNHSRVKRPFQAQKFKLSNEVVPAVFEYEWSKAEEVFGFNDPFGVLNRLSDRLPIKSIGLPAYTVKGKSVIPLHGVAMHPNSVPDINLTLDQALDYLRKDRISAEPNSENGWALVGYKNVCLGWVKILPNRVNNYYPSYYRLRDKNG